MPPKNPDQISEILFMIGSFIVLSGPSIFVISMCKLHNMIDKNCIHENDEMHS